MSHSRGLDLHGPTATAAAVTPARPGRRLDAARQAPRPRKSASKGWTVAVPSRLECSDDPAGAGGRATTDGRTHRTRCGRERGGYGYKTLASQATSGGGDTQSRFTRAQIGPVRSKSVRRAMRRQERGSGIRDAKRGGRKRGQLAAGGAGA